MLSTELGATVRRYKMAKVVKRHADTMLSLEGHTWDLSMGCHSVIGLPTGAPTPENHAASIALVAKVVTDTTARSGVVPTEPIV